VIDLNERLVIGELLARHGQLIDSGELRQWMELFAKECSYRIVPRDNYDRGFPVTLLQCDNRAQLQDRVVALLEANKYNVHTDRHVIGAPTFVGRSADVITIEASFLVMQADAEGVGSVFAFGRYVDEVVREEGEMRFRSKIAIVDSFEIPRAISTPI
jgi:3-phenylpropionate/cinnamic acid dioxygenase small subunit